MSPTLRSGLLALVLGVSLLAGTAMPASADPRNGICEHRDQCLWPLTNFRGSVADMDDVEENYQRRNFIGPGAFAGYNLNDFSMSLQNRDPWADVDTCKHSWFRGPCIKTAPGRERADLGEFNNQMSSHII